MRGKARIESAEAEYVSMGCLQLVKEKAISLAVNYAPDCMTRIYAGTKSGKHHFIDIANNCLYNEIKLRVSQISTSWGKTSQQ